MSKNRRKRSSASDESSFPVDKTALKKDIFRLLALVATVATVFCVYRFFIETFEEQTLSTQFSQNLIKLESKGKSIFNHANYKTKSIYDTLS